MYLRQAGLTSNPSFRIFIPFGVGDRTRLRKPRPNANTHVVGKAVGHQKHDGLDLQRLGFKKAIEINKRLFHERRHWNSKKWLHQTH